MPADPFRDPSGDGPADEVEAPFDTLILGIGNILWADEGFGVRVVERLAASYRFAPSVRLMDGGTQGLYLVQYVQAARNLLVFDAIDYGEAPGNLRVVLGDELPRFMGCRKMSLHQTGFQDVLAAAELLGAAPERMALVGVQAEELEDWGGSLRPAIKARIDPAIALGLDILKDWGIRPRPVELAQETALLSNGLDLAGYERNPIHGGGRS